MFRCEECNHELYSDGNEFLNICPKCGLCYPYQTIDFTYRLCKSPPYKRIWHLFEVIQTLPFSIHHSDLERIQIMFTKYDREYSKRFPRRNFPSYKFVVNYIAQKLELDYITQQLNCKENGKWKLIWDSLDISNYAIYQ